MANKGDATTNATITTTVSPDFNSTGNYTDYSAFWDTLWTFEAVCYPLIAAFIIATCLSLFIVLLSSPSLRSGLRNHLLLSLMATYLLVGIVGMPFVADFAIHRRWRHGCLVGVVFELVTFFFQNFVTIWTVALLVLHYVARVQRYEGPSWLVRLPARLQWAVPGLIVALPWVLAVVMNLPAAFGGQGWSHITWSDEYCPLFLTRTLAVLLSVTSFYLPAIALVGLSISASVLYQRRRKADSHGPGASRAEMGERLVAKTDDDLEPPLVFVLTSGVTVVIMAPEYILAMDTTIPWRTNIVLLYISFALNDCLPFIHAIMWMLLFRDVRQRLLELTAMLPCRVVCRPSRSLPQSSGSTSVPPVTFRDLRDD